MDKPRGITGSTIACYFMVVLAAFIFYALFTQRTVGWQDSGEYQWRVLAGDWTTSQGLARAHPLYIAAGRGILWLTGKENLVYALNLFSGLGMAVALANLFLLGKMLTERIWIAAAGAAMLGVCHTAWWLAEVAEVYTWSLAIFMGELAVLVWLMRQPSALKLCLLAGLAGLGLAVHGFALLACLIYFAVAVVLIAKKKLPLWSLGAGLIFWCAGASLWLGQMAWLWERTNFFYAMKNSLVGIYDEKIFAVNVRHEQVKINLCLTAMNFLNFLLPLAVVGWWRFRRQLGGGMAAALGAITVIHAVFFIRYPVPDKFTFILPTLAMIVVAAMVGIKVLVSRGEGWRRAAILMVIMSLLLGPACYWSLPHILHGRVGEMEKRWPYRNELVYWICPWKQNENSAEKYCMDELSSLPHNARVDLSGRGTELFPMLVLQQAYGVRTDVKLESTTLPGGFMWKQNYDPE